MAARRVLGRPANEVENYATLEEAKDQLRSRSESERQRFLTRYHADKHALRNYDLVCDTTRARPDEVIDLVGGGDRGPDRRRDTPPLLLLDPARIYPTGDIRALRGMDDDRGRRRWPGRTRWSRSRSVTPTRGSSSSTVTAGSARRCGPGSGSVPGTLLAQDNDPVVGGLIGPTSTSPRPSP